MNAKKTVVKGAIASALGVCALGLGAAGAAGIASADPGQPCWQQNCQGDDHHYDGGPDNRGFGDNDHRYGDQWRPDQRDDQRPWEQRDDQRPWDQRGIDDARFDHQPFNWQGQRVEPYWDQDRNAWGFWFFGMWIPM